MTRLGTRCTLFAALAAVAFASPVLSQDKPAAGPGAAPPAASSPPAASAPTAPAGEARREPSRGAEKQVGTEDSRGRGVGEMRREGDRDGMRRARRGEFRSGVRVDVGERRHVRSGVRVELGERYVERRYHRRPARFVIVKHHRRHHRHY